MTTIKDMIDFQPAVNELVKQNNDKPLIRFFFPDPNKLATSACVELSWCIEEPLKKWIEENQIPNPHIILCNVVDHREIARKIVPLAQGTTFVDFHRGGKNEIHAMLCFGFKSSRAIIKKYSDRFRVDLWDRWENKFESDIFKGGYTVFRGEVLNLNANCSVDVAKEMFAAEPNKHVLFFVNLWYESSLIDQCHYRRRLILTATLKIWPILIWSILSSSARLFMAYTYTVLGFKNLRWKTIVHPWTEPFGMLFNGNDCTNSVFWFYDKNHDIIWKKAALLLIWPFFWFEFLPAISLIPAFTLDISFLDAYLRSVLVVIKYIIPGILLGGLSLAAIILGYTALIDKLNQSNIPEKLANWLNSRPERRSITDIIQAWLEPAPLTEKDREIMRQRSMTQFQKMQCPIDPTVKYVAPKPVDPVQHLTLSYERLKSKVCKPFPK